jgi:glycosyltransferase involved in cell wall biosynthesis
MYTGSFFLYGWKGVDTLIAAAKQFPREVELVLVGGSTEEMAAIQAATTGYPAGSIRLIGRVRHPEIPGHLASADILVLPNNKGDANSERYTSPLKLFEYMASGKPIIASDLPSMREVLNENNCTFFFPGDPTSLARAVQTVLDDPSAAQSKASQSLADVQRYSWKKRARAIVEFVRNV